MGAPKISDFLAHAMLDHFFGATVKTAPATFYLALFNGVTELSGSGYARLAITNNTTNFPNAASRLKALAVATAFAAATGGWSDVDGWKLMDAAVAGNVYLEGDTQDLGLICRAIASADTLNYTSHGLTDGDAVRVIAPAGHSLPTGISAATTYYVRDSAANSFKLAATSGGAAIDLTADGMALVAKWYGKTGIVATDVYNVPVSGLKAKISEAIGT